MTISDFHEDDRWCPSCDLYVPYLLSPDDAYCIWCGDTVRLFSDEDQAALQASLKQEGGRRPPMTRRANESEVA